MPDTTITLDLSTWRRLDDLRRYAEIRRISVEEAIERLVNTGLSYL